MATPVILGIGELLWDCLGDTQQPGGAPANVAFHASQLGTKGLVVSRVGCDEPGTALLRELARRGVPIDAIQRDDHHPTGRVTVDTTIPDQPEYTIHEGVAWDHIEFDDRLLTVARAASAICFGTLAQRSSASRKAIQRVLEANERSLPVYDVNLRPPWYTRDVIVASLRRCHVAKLNDDEVLVLMELLAIREANVRSFAMALRAAFDVQIVCITRGARGCFALSGDEQVDLPGSPVDVVDTVGAGDAFMAAFVCGLLWQWSLERSSRFATEVGGLVAGHRGAMPELRGELRRLRNGVE